MCIFCNRRIETYLEEDRRLSKHNYSVQKNYSIQSALAKKRLLYDSSYIVHIMIDLKAYCDYQLPEISLIA